MTSLRELAEAATPGAYTASEILDDGRLGILSADNVIVVGVTRNLSREDAAYIAACSPERILALLDCIEAADALRKDYYAAGITCDGGNAMRDYDAKRKGVGNP